MLLSQAQPAKTTDPTSLEVSSTEVLIATQQVLFGSAAAVGVRRDSIGVRFVAAMRQMFATATDPSPRRPYHPKRYAFIEDAAMARAMERL